MLKELEDLYKKCNELGYWTQIQNDLKAECLGDMRNAMTPEEAYLVALKLKTIESVMTRIETRMTRTTSDD